MKVLIAGSTGMLGRDCKDVLDQDHEVITPSSKEMDIISWDVVIDVLQNTSPDVVLNCAAFTDVDACETERFATQKVNVEGPRNLAQCCARFECKLIHISSDYVFDGFKPIPQPYFEDDLPNPLSAYGMSKMESEKAVRENAPDYVIIRTAWLYGANGKNFVTSIVSQALQKKQKILKVVDDQFGSPTWTYRLALQIKEFLAKDVKGTYHATAEGFCSRFECARHILEILGVDTDIQPCSMNEFKSPARRPSNCLLENRQLKQQGLNVMRNWKEDIKTFLEKYADKIIQEAESTAS